MFKTVTYTIVDVRKQHLIDFIKETPDSVVILMNNLLHTHNCTCSCLIGISIDIL